MVVLVAWLSIIGPWVVNLLPHPSLVCVDWRLAVVTESNVIYDHSFLSLLVSLLSSRPPQGVARVVQPSAALCTGFMARWVLRIDRSFLQRLRLLRYL
jgi:hypothetical protein